MHVCLQWFWLNGLISKLLVKAVIKYWIFGAWNIHPKSLRLYLMNCFCFIRLTFAKGKNLNKKNPSEKLKSVMFFFFFLNFFLISNSNSIHWRTKMQVFFCTEIWMAKNKNLSADKKVIPMLSWPKRGLPVKWLPEPIIHIIGCQKVIFGCVHTFRKPL